VTGFGQVYGPVSQSTRDVLLELREHAWTWLHTLEVDARRLPVGAQYANNTIVRDELAHLLDGLRVAIDHGRSS